MFERFLTGLIGGAAFGVTCYATSELISRRARFDATKVMKEHNAVLRERIEKATQEIKNFG